MTPKKYELTTETISPFGRPLYRIRALVPFGAVKAGDLGGYIESENNLSHEGEAWVFDKAWVFEEARVFEDARVFDKAQVYGKALVFGNALVFNEARVFDRAQVFGDSWVCS